MRSVSSTDKRTGRWKKYGRIVRLSAPRRAMFKSARTPEWASGFLGFSRERAEIAEFIPARPGYISDNAVAFGLSCNFLEDEARCDRWRSWWKSCRGRGHVALPSNLRRDRSERGHEEGPAASSTSPSLALFAKKNKKDCEARQKNLGSKTRVKHL